jgi:gamma-butyrobetaine dioxygenase
VVRWDASISKSPPRLSYDFVCRSDEARLDLYRRVLDHGFVFLTDVPCEPGRIAEAAGMFGLVRLSPYAGGDDQRVEDVRTDSRVKVGTTMSHFLPPHTDTCWRASVSGLVFLHCLEQHESGGESILVDGLEVVHRLREADPEAFEVLSSVPVNFSSSVNNGDEWRALGRIITCDAEGNPVGFRFNDRSIQQLDLPDELIEPVYSAIAGLETILYDPALWLRRKLKPGDLMVVDNQRVLHGRTHFDSTVGERHLQHCSVDRDVFHNTYRRLARALGEDDWNQVLPWGLC